MLPVYRLLLVEARVFSTTTCCLQSYLSHWRGAPLRRYSRCRVAMALKGSPVLAETLADLLAEIGMIFQNEDVFAMAPLDEVQVLAPMNGGAWTVIMSFRLIWDGSPVAAAAEEKLKAWILVNPATNVVSIESFEAYIKNHELMVAAQRGHRLTMVKSISMSSLQIITKRTKVDEPPSSL